MGTVWRIRPVVCQAWTLADEQIMHQSMADTLYDVAIVGAGPVGSALALGLSRAGLETLLLDGRDPSEARRADGRNFALVTGSQRLFGHLGLADALASAGQPLHGLEAVDGGTHFFGRPSVLFADEDLDSADPGESLGIMVQAEQLQAGLDDAVSRADHLTLQAPAQFAGLIRRAAYVELDLAGADPVCARLVVGADGLRSSVRDALGIATEGRDYGKSVFTANVRLQSPHAGIARQLFLPEGPFAILPLPADRANLAWYMKRGAAEALSRCAPKDIEAELNHRLAEFAGEMRLDGPAGSYPLILQVANRLVAPRGVVIGDAARRVNPLAGQGLNQGFRDVAALMDCLEEASRAGLDIGSDVVLARYSEHRRFDGLGAALALDGIDRLFSNDSLLTKPIRAAGLLAAQKISPLRRILARQASATEDGVPGPMKGW